jgi:hypothetical protein
MKLHSDNVRVAAGYLALQNLNVFADPRIADPTLANFRQLAERVADVGRDMLHGELRWDDLADLDAMRTLPVLSIPRLHSRAAGLTLAGGPLLWGGLLLRPGFTFQFDADERLVVAEYAEPGCAVQTTFKTTTYDVYNHEPLAGIDPAILRELDVPLTQEIIQKAQAEFDNTGNDLLTVKAMSLYAPGLAEAGPGTAVAADLRPEPAEGYTREAAAQAIEVGDGSWKGPFYDQFWVEWVDRSSPFAYVNVEAAVTPGKPEQQADAFGTLFSRPPEERTRAAAEAAVALWAEAAR